MKSLIAISFVAIAAIALSPAYSQNNVPVNLTAEDLVTKVYGVFSPESSKAQICEDCVNMLNVDPSEEDMGLWIDSSDGYRFSYYGLTVPYISAMVSIERDSVTNFGFFFLFPYNAANRDEMNCRQAQFCGSLLQEMYDLGISFSVIGSSDSLFEICGDYKGNFIKTRLSEEPTGDSEGRYVLCLSVEPDAFTPADNLAAQ